METDRSPTLLWPLASAIRRTFPEISKRAPAPPQAGIDALALLDTVDSVFTGDDTIPFLDRTFNDRERFEKVVFRYSPDDGEATSLR